MKTLRFIALLEFVKGFVVLLISILLFYLSKDSNELQMPEFFKHIHVLSAGPFLYKKLVHGNYNKEGFLLLWALVYSSLRFFEAYGLWNAKTWGFLIGIISVSIYLPFEFFEIFKEITFSKIIITLINLIILIYLIRQKQQRI